MRALPILHLLLCAAAVAQETPPPAPPAAPATPASPATPAPHAEPVNTAAPRIWIFNGIPGDDEHHDFYTANLAALRKTFTERFAVPANQITVLYGPQSAGYDGPCTREAMLAELAKVAAHTQQPNAAPAWIILQGHANAVTGGAMYNLPGPDVSMREIGDALKTANAAVPLVVVGTTTCSADLVKRLAAPGRLVMTATTTGDPENETEFPAALAEALAAEATDANGDRMVTVTELFQATSAAVLKIYEAGKFIVKEHAQLDGNGDGKATQRPAPEDAKPASRAGLAIGGGKPKFE
jgi:hypothetical protein